MLWTVARFPDGYWCTGGKPEDPDYAKCEVWQVEAVSRDEAKKKAQAKRSAAKRKERAQASPPALNQDGGSNGH